MDIGNVIDAELKKRGISANKLALEIGVTPSTIYSLIQRGSDRISIDLLIKIAHALGTSADSLLGIAKPQTFADVATSQESLLLRKYRQLPAEAKERVNKIIDVELEQSTARKKGAHSKRSA